MGVVVFATRCFSKQLFVSVNRSIVMMSRIDPSVSAMRRLVFLLLAMMPWCCMVVGQDVDSPPNRIGDDAAISQSGAQDRKGPIDGGQVDQGQVDQAGNDAALAAYADAANFQTGGAIELAIQAWNRFVADFPKHPMVPQALHYLGVCHMQTEQPDYRAASTAFTKALEGDDYPLREESLANLGWCLYRQAGESKPDPAKQSLRRAIQVFKQLRDEFSSGRFIDRALFYSGEAAFGLGQHQQAVEYYDQLLSLPMVKQSPLRCDALYARGVAHETLQDYDDAIDSYLQLIDQCKDSDLLGDVYLRVGDIRIAEGQFDDAIESLQQAFDLAASADDRSYAIFRQAFALVQSDRPTEAAGAYDRLVEQFPETPYFDAARMASAKISYRAGDMDRARNKFQPLVDLKDVAAATEAAHWLTRIALNRSEWEQAATVARDRIDRGTKGSFAAELQLDLAEALAVNPETVGESVTLFRQVYETKPNAKTAPRALYNAAFSEWQLGRTADALNSTHLFLDRFPDHPLAADMRFLLAESLLDSEQPEAAIEQFQQLIRTAPRDHPQYPMWTLRLITALVGNGEYEPARELIARQGDSFDAPEDRAESQYLLGKILAAQGNTQQAAKEWNELVATYPESSVADQARYEAAKIAIGEREFDRGIELYQQILDAGKSANLLPYARYGIAWAKMQQGDYERAISQLDRLSQDGANDQLSAQAYLALGICRRNTGQFDQAKADLESFLATSPNGVNLGHALYELALIDQRNQSPQAAAAKLRQLVSEVPQYPAMDKVLYELGWSLQQSGDDRDALENFQRLVTQYPETSLAADAAYYIGQSHYAAQQWDQAAKQFQIAVSSDNESLSEKALYRLGWSRFKLGEFDQSETAFAKQHTEHPDGPLAFDALAMVAESRFKRGDYEKSLAGFEIARQQIRLRNDTSNTVRDEAARQLRELVLLHGGQSAAQLGQWDAAIDWHSEHRDRFPSSNYLAQVFYETGYAYHQTQQLDQALNFYSQVADKYRNEVGARARFMIGEIYFEKRELDKAIPEFQRVMFGYGAEEAPEQIKNWQAKSGFEAGRCSEVLIDLAKTPASKTKAQKFATNFYGYVADKHADHELAKDALKRMEALSR